LIAMFIGRLRLSRGHLARSVGRDARRFEVGHKWHEAYFTPIYLI
jgi:hypothetical protein